MNIFPQGPKVSSEHKEVKHGITVKTPEWTWLYFSGQFGYLAIWVKFTTWREHAYYDKTLHIKAELMGNDSYYQATNNYTHSYEARFGLPGKSDKYSYESPQMDANLFPALVTEKMQNRSIEITIENTDIDEYALAHPKEPINLQELLVKFKDFGAWVQGYIYIYDKSTDWSGTVHRKTSPKDFNISIWYPPYRTLFGDEPNPPDPKPIGSTTGGPDIYKPSITVTANSTYSISKVGVSQSISWNPTDTEGRYAEPITNKAVIEKVGEFSSSPANFSTPSPAASSYRAYVERYYTNYPSIMARSNTITLYTYSQPTLSGITLSKYTLSPRAEESLRITLNGMNNKTWGIENNFRTGIWSNIKAKYYIDETNTNSYRDLSVDNIKTMFPDTSAVNGVVNGVVKVNRRNLGVSGGNPGSGQLVYETDTRTQNITIKYTPTKPIDPNKEPNNDPSNSGLRYNKRENNIQGAKLTAGHTWVLPNTYNIGTMTGVDVTIQYPKTDDAGVLNGYRIRLISANDGSPHANETYYEHHYDTTDYTKTFTIPYDIIRRGVSGNIIEITPYYKPSTGGYWYGPTITKKFVDIAWMLGDPVIDCPLTGTTWHNHQYRVLFKLPIDRDTNYKGQNDIEFYYGAGTYRYQEIQIDINGTITTIGNNAYMNAQNSWNSPVNINNAKLTYLRNIIINQSLIPTYKVDDYYFIKIRVRKAYGQNPNWDGWSNWSQPITVGRKTVSNTNVVRHETIMASHYMNVQDAFNKCTACYAKTASNNQNFVVQESFDRKRGDNINGPHLSPPSNTPFKTIREYVSEFNDLHQLKNKINSYGTFDTDKDRSKVKLDYQNKLLATFVPSQEFITAEKDQNGATECDSPSTILKGRNYMKYMCDELNNLW